MDAQSIREQKGERAGIGREVQGGEVVEEERRVVEAWSTVFFVNVEKLRGVRVPTCQWMKSQEFLILASLLTWVS